MVLDGGVVSTSAITSSFTAILRISQAVYELKAVGEQTRDLLDTTKYVNSSLEAVRELRRKKSDLLNREEKKWIDQQTEFTQKAVDSVAVLIEKARVDMQARNETGNEDDFKSKHIKLHHRAQFVLRDGPKVQTNLTKVTIAMNGLNSAMVTLSSREGHSQDHYLQPSKVTTVRGRSPSGKAPPPYAEGDFLNRRRTIQASMNKGQAPQRIDFLSPDEPEASQIFGSQTVPHQPLHPRASMSSISPSINFTSVSSAQYYENAIADDNTSPACVPTSVIRDSIGSEAYFTPRATDSTAFPPSNYHEMEVTTPPRPYTHEMNAADPIHPILHTYNSAPAVPTRAPTIPRKPVEYQRHRASTPSISSITPSIASITSIHDEFAQHLANPWASSTPQSQSQPHSPHRPPIDAQKDLPMLPLYLRPTQSTASLNRTLSDPSSDASAMGPPPVSRGRSWLIDRANQAAAGNTAPLSRTQSNNLPYPYHSPDNIRSTPGAWT